MIYTTTKIKLNVHKHISLYSVCKQTQHKPNENVWQKEIRTHTCRWELQGGVGASLEACRQEVGQQKAGQKSCVRASAGLVPLVL